MKFFDKAQKTGEWHHHMAVMTEANLTINWTSLLK